MGRMGRGRGRSVENGGKIGDDRREDGEDEEDKEDRARTA